MTILVAVLYYILKPNINKKLGLLILANWPIPIKTDQTK